MNYCEDPARRVNNFSFFLGVIDDPGTVHFLCQGKKMNFFEIAIWLHIILLALHCLRYELFGFHPAFWHSGIPAPWSAPWHNGTFVSWSAPWHNGTFVPWSKPWHNEIFVFMKINQPMTAQLSNIDCLATPSIPEIIWAKNVRAIVVCGFLMKSLKKHILKI